MAEWDGRDDRGETVGKGIYFVDGRVGGQIRQARVTFLR
jgi:flagellar hook assembly protein FlgD